MKQSLQPTQNPEELLAAAYAAERARLFLLAESDDPAGDYRNPVFGCGALPCDVLFLGEAPGGEEAKLGRPFVGRAGAQLDELLLLGGIDRENVYITNTVKYRPVVRSAKSVRNRTPGKREILAGLPLLSLELTTVRPKVVATLGNTPLAAVYALANAKPSPVGAVHGEPCALQIGEMGFVLWPLYHPASGIYNRALVPVMEQDAGRLGAYLAEGRNPRS